MMNINMVRYVVNGKLVPPVVYYHVLVKSKIKTV